MNHICGLKQMLEKNDQKVNSEYILSTAESHLVELALDRNKINTLVS